MASWLPWYPVLDYSLARDELAAQLAGIMRHSAATAPAPRLRGGSAAASALAEWEDGPLAASWGRPGGPVTYALVPAEAVEPAVRRAALAGRDFASAHLGIETPAMRFYRPEGEGERAYRERYGVADWLSFTASAQNGHADRTTETIGVRADIAAALAAEVAAHEVRHLTQPGRDDAAEERHAQAYGEWVAGVIAPDGTAVGVHRFDGFPYRYSTLPGVADPGDVLIANDAGTIGVFRNFGSRARPEWVEHYAACPVSIGRAA